MKLHDFDLSFSANSNFMLAGADEAGRGAWAGPLVAAAVVMREVVPLVNDSKQLTEKQRERLFPLVMKAAKAVSVVSIDAATIDTLGVHEANKLALSLAITYLDVEPQVALVDGFYIEHFVPIEKVIGGDAQSYAIASSSIVAKVVRDRMMRRIDAIDSRYHFAEHKGYGTAKHRLALETHGVSSLHRMSFEPVRKIASS